MGRGKGLKEQPNPDKRAIAIRNLEIARQKRRDQLDELKKLKEEKQEQEERIETKTNKRQEPDEEYDEEDILYLGNQPTAYEIYLEEQKILKSERQAKKKLRHKKLKNELSELKKMTAELKESLTSQLQTNKKDAFEERLANNILKF